jgi:DNA-binding NarL/FixJ family response regulator
MRHGYGGVPTEHCGVDAGDRGAEKIRAANQRLRVLLVDDDALFRRGLSDLLIREGIDVAAEVWTGTAAVVRTADVLPDVVLLGLSTDVEAGLSTMREIRASSPSTPIVILASTSDTNHVLEAVSADTNGIIVKSASVKEIVSGLRSAAVGEVYISPVLVPGLLARVRSLLQAAPKPVPSDSLSRRENEVLRLLACGLENAEIAAEMNITVRTVKAHVSSILDKLGVENRVQAAVVALRQADDVTALPPAPFSLDEQRRRRQAAQQAIKFAAVSGAPA